jgi:hypothetical protein
MLNLKLAQLPSSILGIYGPKGDLLPERMRYLHPDAAASYLAIDAGPRRLRVSDMWRSAESSFQAMHEKRGVQPPGKSGHNFGFSIDLDIKWMMSTHGITKAQLDSFMNENGWHCHRKDHLLDSEAWHYNYFGADSETYLAVSAPFGSTSAGLEQKIKDVYGASFVFTAVDLQGAVECGAVVGTAGPDTQRLLAFVSCQRELVTLPAPAALVA